MALRSDVPPAQPLRVHGDRRAGPPCAAGDEMSDEPVEAAVEERGADIDGEDGLQVTRAAERLAQVAAGQPEHRRLLPLTPGPFDDPPRLRVGPHDDAVGRQRARLAPRLAFLDRHDTLTLPRPRPT